MDGHEGTRINKYLSEAGVCSRREADRQVMAGNVTVGGEVATAGTRVKEGQEVVFCGRTISPEEEDILLALYKPAGIVSTAEKRERDNVVDFVHYPKRVYPVGRLDKESEGLLLLTNNGDIVNRIMRAGNMHEKEYIVTVDRPVTDFFLRGMAGGVPLAELGVTTRKCRTERVGKREFRIVLTQGINRQIRRMCEYFGYRVRKLVRVRIMNIELGGLREGEYRRVQGEEYEELLRGLSGSSNDPVIRIEDSEEYEELLRGLSGSSNGPVIRIEDSEDSEDSECRDGAAGSRARARESRDGMAKDSECRDGASGSRSKARESRDGIAEDRGGASEYRSGDDKNMLAGR